MKKCEISIRFRFGNGVLSQRVGCSLSGKAGLPFSEPASELPDNVHPLWSNSSFDEIVSPFSKIRVKKETECTELLFSFSSEEDDELQTLILELLHAAMVEDIRQQD